ncbi:MAG: HAMP domain-containing sensor histidine kinase [Acidimicrobiales bacterium]|nr:HAMP domain-containing sensor histidine kinase [Acidimicrobiales bacterium]
MTAVAEPRNTLRPVGLRARISMAFAIGGLLLSVALAGATMVLSRGQLIETHEESAAAVAVSNAVRLNNQLTPDTTVEDLPSIVDSLTSLEGSQRLVRLRTDWLLAPEFGHGDIPGVLTAHVENGQPGQIRAIVAGRPQLVIGLPLPSFDAAYYVVFDLDGVADTLGTIRIILLSAGAATTLLGAVIGWWASRRTLRPLRRVSAAARAIAGGRLDTRLERQADPDLNTLADSFNGMAEALEARISRDARFASEVSHELRSPLMTLTTTVGILEARRDQFSERSRTALDLLSQDLARFSRLVEDLLEISRFDAGAASLELTEINVTNFVHASLSAAHLGDVAVTDGFGDRPAVIDGDKRRLARVMANLLDNATHHGGGLTGVFMERDAEVVRIGIEDDGPGVPTTERELIFDRFSRGSSGGRRGGDSGAGLGLSLVWEDVRLHTGRVWVEDRSDGGSGARFIIELPLPPDDPEEATT